MKNSKLALVIIIFFSAVSFVYAEEIKSPVPDLGTLVNNVTSLIRPVVIFTFLGVMMYGGFTRMTAAGNSDQEAKSVQIMTAGIIGFAIFVLAPVIIDLVQQILGISINI